MLIIIALIVVSTALGGGDDDAPDASAPAANTAPDQDAAGAEPAGEDAAAEPEDEAPGPGIGDAVQDGKFEFVVTEIETGIAEVGDEYLNEQAQGQFVLVHMTVSNTGDRAQMLDGSNQKLVDTQGREHSADGSAAIYLGDTGTFLNDINPGNSVEGTVVFDIPSDAEPASITLHDSMFSGGVTVSYFEWVQNKNAVTWSAEQVDRELNRHMVVAAQRTLQTRSRLNCTLRSAAYATALEHIGAVYKVRGIFP